MTHLLATLLPSCWGQVQRMPHLRLLTVITMACGLLPSLVSAQTPPPLVVIGDSLAEGVQSADASVRTQPFSFAAVLAARVGVPLSLPLIRGGPFSTAGDTSSRSRLAPALPAANLGVSGATVGSALRERADGILDREVDLVLSPRVGSQIEVAESLRAPFVLCWLGSNDALRAVLAYDQLDASQLTPVDQFAADFREIVDRLSAAGSTVILANLPDVSDIAYLLDRQDLVKLLGTDYGLPAGHFTTVPAALTVKLGLANGAIFTDPRFVLDPSELAAIRARIVAYNRVIQEVASARRLALADVYGLFKSVATSQPSILGVRLTSRYLGGLFSLDGVHPSNLGHALVASAFISAINARFGVAIPHFSLAEWTAIAAADPFLDKNGNGRVAGRPGAGLVETLGPSLGISGDLAELPIAFGAARR